MIIFPAIDIIGGKAVRLYKGDYAQMTVYSDDPASVALKFKEAGAEWVHLVDLEGAKNGDTPNLETVLDIKRKSGLLCEIGGGIRNMEVVNRYLEAGIDRVILGTAAVENPDFLKAAIEKYGEKIAVGIDIKDGFVAIKGWLEKSKFEAFEFCKMMEDMGVKTLICTDISKDGAMQGTNRELYKLLAQKYTMNIIASGGVSSLEDIQALKAAGVHGAIIGKAYYTGAIDLAQAVKLGEGE